MVTCVDFIVNLAVVWREMIGAQNMVDAEIKAFPII